MMKTFFATLNALSVVVCTGVFLSGCSSMNRSLSLGTVGGTVTGTFMGAAIARKDKPKNAAKCALIGGLMGAAAGYFIHKGLDKRDEKTRRELLFNLESFGISEPRQRQKVRDGGNPSLSKPVVDSQWVETRIEGNRLIEAHRVWIIKENPKWVPRGESREQKD